MIAQTVSQENTRRDPTCACGKRDYCDNSCNTFRSPAQYITIAQHGNRFNWQRHTAGLVWTSRETYATELDAAIDAVGIARCYGVAVRLPVHLRKPIADHYRNVGRMAYLRQQPLDACHNEFERLGWTLASLADARMTAEAAALFVERESPFAIEHVDERMIEVYA